MFLSVQNIFTLPNQNYESNICDWIFECRLIRRLIVQGKLQWMQFIRKFMRNINIFPCWGKENAFVLEWQLTQFQNGKKEKARRKKEMIKIELLMVLAMRYLETWMKNAHLPNHYVERLLQCQVSCSYNTPEGGGRLKMETRHTHIKPWSHHSHCSTLCLPEDIRCGKHSILASNSKG